MSRSRLLGLLYLYALFCAAIAADASAALPAMDRPNLVLVNLDDARFDALDRMPTLRDRIRSHAVIFRNGFAPTAVCNPSRASLLTGLSAFRHRIRSQTGPMGSAEVFRERGLDHRTIAVWLQTAGYSTGLFGKYLNGYWEKTEAGLGPGGAFYVPPGWDRWQALVVASKYGGRDGESYQVVDETGRLTRFEDHSTDDEYHTDQSGAALRAFVRSSIARGRPFFAYWAPNAPHTGTTGLPVPARRHRDVFADLPAWRPPSWNEPDVSDKPRWVQLIEATAEVQGHGDRVRRRAYESLLSVDEQLAALLELFAELGIADRTVLLVTSDNGAAWGAHRLHGNTKSCAYEECQRVPLLVMDPRRVERGPMFVDAPVLSMDLAPTLAELAGAAIPVDVDGRSFAGFWLGDPPRDWRSDYLLAYWRLRRSTGLRVVGNPGPGDQLRLFAGDPIAPERSAFIFQFVESPAKAREQSRDRSTIAVEIGTTPRSTLERLAVAVRRVVPGIRAMLWKEGEKLSFFESSDSQHGVYLQVLANRSGALRVEEDLPDFVGVRDVAGGFTWVAYETGERELYDLSLDPHQLDNRADDRAYRKERVRLEARTRELLAGYAR